MCEFFIWVWVRSFIWELIVVNLISCLGQDFGVIFLYCCNIVFLVFFLFFNLFQLYFFIYSWIVFVCFLFFFQLYLFMFGFGWLFFLVFCWLFYFECDVVRGICGLVQGFKFWIWFVEEFRIFVFWVLVMLEEYFLVYCFDFFLFLVWSFGLGFLFWLVFK